MEFEQSTVLRLLGSDAYYGVPDFQRDYVWRSGTRGAEVDQLLDDLSRAFQEDDAEVYFLGSMVAYEDESSGRRMLVDGQQRTATLVLLLSAMHSRLRGLVSEEVSQGTVRDEDREGLDDLLTSLRLCTRRVRGGETSPLRFQFPDETTNDVLEKMIRSGSATLSAGRGGNRYFLVRATSKCEQVLADSFPSLNDIERFATFVLSKVEVVMIKTTDFTTAYRVFWTLNDRGRALTASDLLKNFLFSQQPAGRRADVEILRRTWRACTDTLESAGEPTPDRFLRYYLIASLDIERVVPARQLFRTIQEHQSDLGADRPVTFARQILASARRYVAFRKGNRSDGAAVRGLLNIHEMAPSVTQPLAAVLAVPEGLQRGTGFAELCDLIETLALVYGVTRERWNVFESALPAITRSLRAARSQEDLRDVADALGRDQIQTRRRQFWAALEDVRNVPERTQRFLLAAIALLIQEKTRASEYRSLQELMRLSIEHIVPQGVLVDGDAAGARWREYLGGLNEAEAGELVYALGNLTLLPSEVNSMIGGKPFEDKRQTFADQPLLMTRMIAEDIRAGHRTGRREFADAYEIFPCDVWDRSKIQDRQAFMKRLVAERWPLLSEEAN